ncbi:MAG: hypothetical protein GX982_05060 [Tissierellia bacterium]|nr:hypothetical protein [Tissierellia bacterium]
MSNFMNPTNIIIIIVFCILLILYIISIYKDKKKAKAVYNKANKDNLVYLAIDNNTKVYSIDGLIPLEAKNIDFNRFSEIDRKNINKIYVFEYVNVSKIKYSIGSKVRPLKKSFQTGKLTTILNTKPGHVYVLTTEFKDENVEIKFKDITPTNK